MAASTAARRMANFLSIAILLALGTMASAQSESSHGSVVPSNATLPPSESASQSVLRLSGGPVFDGKWYNIAPLTVEVGKGLNAVSVAAIKIQGVFKRADYSSTGNLEPEDIAFICCDQDSSNIDASTVIENACMIQPQAIVLYSLTSQSCNLTQGFNYTSIFTMTSRRDSGVLMTTTDLYPPQTNILRAVIGANTTTTGGSPANTPAQTSPEVTQAPTTAVAMSILYSITGIITLLFLIIIATGAIRAHRHPERYGPRNGFQGRPRQSRAKGLARAMLETIPIVKFGDPEPVKPGNRDIELEDGRSTSNSAPIVSSETVIKREPSPVAVPAVESGLGPAQAESVHSGQEAAATNEGELGCSICTEDFMTGEDVRVLPCQHKYHPACIDPWLLNVSGTCPLCRHDLRPATSSTSNPGSPTSMEGELPPPLEPEDRDTSNNRRRSRFLDLNRLRHAPPDERIAALRRLREQSQREGEPSPEERSSTARVTTRLRDVFHIRTRTESAAPSS